MTVKPLHSKTPRTSVSEVAVSPVIFSSQDVSLILEGIYDGEWNDSRVEVLFEEDWSALSGSGGLSRQHHEASTVTAWKRGGGR
jgi:hypothetical protein